MPSLIRCLPLCLVLAAPAWAQAPVAAKPPSDAAMMAGMDRMNHAMAAVPMTGDTDRDFVAMMLPHHSGAIDMAQIELRSGKDPALRKLARAIVTAQAREIKVMQQWQASHKQAGSAASP